MYYCLILSNQIISILFQYKDSISNEPLDENNPEVCPQLPISEWPARVEEDSYVPQSEHNAIETIGDWEWLWDWMNKWALTFEGNPSESSYLPIHVFQPSETAESKENVEVRKKCFNYGIKKII